jgi:hypothetical protein
LFPIFKAYRVGRRRQAAWDAIAAAAANEWEQLQSTKTVGDKPNLGDR